MAGVLKQLVVVAALGAAGAGAWQYWASAGAPEASGGRRGGGPTAVVAEVVGVERVERTVSAVGAAQARRSVELAPSAAGRVVEIAVEGGETVAAGDVVLRLESDAQTAALAQAEAELARARAAFDRFETLAAEGRVAANVLEEARADLAAAEAARAAAEKALRDRTLRAPFGGSVGFRAVDLGAMVEPGDRVATLDDVSALDVDFSAPERFFGAVAIGAPVRATTAIYPEETFEGRVTAIDRRIDAVTRSFRARARIPNPGGRLPAGAFMRVTLVLDRREGVVAPEESVVIEAGAPYVLVAAPDGEGWRAERRAVRLGQRLPGRVEVLDGLDPGERVVTRGVQRARDGAPLRLLDDDGDAGAPAGAPGA